MFEQDVEEKRRETAQRMADLGRRLKSGDVMHDRDLRCYGGINFDGATLSEALKLRGFEVCPLPWEDPLHSKTDPTVKQAKLEEMRVKALHAFDQLPKPVVLVCSAGIDRSAPAAAFIFETLRARGTI
ncbi:MAG: hypothetical protein WD904_14725 [Dehalococcoidia bacterium]